MPKATRAAMNLVVLCGFTSIIITTVCAAVAFKSANILFLLPVPSSSHRLWNNVLIEALEERGHNLTILTVETERSRRNVTYICMKKIYESLNEFYYSENDDVGAAMVNRKSSFKIIKENYQLGNFVSRKISESDGLQKLLDYPKTFKFHAIIFDYSMAQSLLALVAHFNFPPLISISPQLQPMRFTAASSTPLFPSYISHYSTMSTTKSLREKLNERFLNGFIYHTFDWFYGKFIYMKNENRRAMKILGEKNHSEKLTISLEQLEYSDLVLVNRNFAFDDVLPLPPNVVPVAGLQAQRKNEIQNHDVIEFVEKSEKPIILFTMGSSMLAEDLGYEIMHEVMNAFQKLLNDFNVICKCNEKFIRKFSQPQNVLYVEWMQQNELLANRKVRLIVSHGGMLTIQEAIWHEKPILGMPIQIEHQRNIERAIELGFAESINFENFTAIEMAIKIRQLIESPIYRNSIRKASKLMKSRPMMPKETAIYWIEQVLEHKGLKHLHFEARKLSFYKLYNIDIISIIVIILLIYILIMQYHFIKEWLLKKNEETAVRKDKVMNEIDKLKNE
ncbi:hypothetical protein PVAND_003088 [Polypedilum vanderplanki]|uniref:UDP-glucuronosyltransferase n=1 Tax=Polypedilum vanderplanki TaxID=319348 RepID=A0A9J6BTH2_POLVA|nr:hypothetical protein PVAND_003088 [Polypedilum vanderplanki]